ncbi:MAG: HNH endonuclease [Limnohabitans sp.]|nr:HNH endonuclease [Limnohabitans sp.]
MTFQERYGTIGDGFIHVHHVVPLSTIHARYKVDPINDLVPLCANCHSMVHRENPPLTIAQLKSSLSSGE